MEVKHNKKQKRFEIEENGAKAALKYGMRGKTMFFMHTDIPESLRGKGIGTKLAEAGLTYSKDENFKIAVMCPFVSRYVKKHPEWYSSYDPAYHQIRRP